jgi:drug/metabolite transporter (DMT)-like permease
MSYSFRQAPVWMSDLSLLLVAIVWGTSYGLAKQSVALYPVLGFLAIRFCLTFVLLLPSLRNLGAAEGRNALKAGIPLGLVLLSIFMSETFGVMLTSASNAAFLISLCVVFTPFMEWLILARRPEMTKKLTADKSMSTLTLTAVQGGVVGLGSLLAASVIMPGGLPSLPTSMVFWGNTLYLVLFCTIFAFFAQNWGVQRSDPTRVSLLMGSEPLFGALFAMLWLGEKLNASAWIGGALIVAASLWITLPRRSAPTMGIAPSPKPVRRTIHRPV